MSCLRKEKMIIALMGTALLLLTSCRNEIQTDISSTESPAVVQEVSMTQEEEASSFSFDDLKMVQFRFSSGAGAWATILNIREDGSFHGRYQDSNSEIGEGYPNGSCYQCDFSGQFTEPVKVNDYTWSMEIARMDYEKEPGTEEIIDGILYRYSDVYGLEDAEDILIYLPGAPLEELPQEFRSWIGYYELSGDSGMELPFYALNNESQQEGFVGIDLRARLSDTEAQAALLEKQIQEDDLTQEELNSKSWDVYSLWDSLLNEIWKRLKDTQDAAKMEELTEKEREWISWKEQQISEAGKEFEGGSMESMVRAQKGAELTRKRVYELMEIVEGKR